MKVNIPEKARLVSVAANYAFAVSDTNQLFAWRPSFITHEDEPMLVEKPTIGEIIDIKSSNFSTILLTSEKLVYKIEHPAD